MNSIMIEGRLTKEPELKTSGEGKEYMKFTLATNHYNHKDKKNDTDFFDCLIVGVKSAAISKYVHKGDQIIVKGSIQSSKGKKEENKDKTYWTVMVDDFAFGTKKSSTGSSEQVQPGDFVPIDDSEVPF